MKLYEILKTCGEILALDLPDEYFSSEVSEVTDARAKILVNCANFVNEELYRDYATSLRKTVVYATDGFIPTAALKMCKVISLTDSQGVEVKFRYGDGGVYVSSDGRYNVCYARLPDILGWLSEVTLPSPRITERILVYGIVREYYAVLGDWANAKQWDDRFKDALQVACCKTSSMRLPIRGWL